MAKMTSGMRMLAMAKTQGNGMRNNMGNTSNMGGSSGRMGNTSGMEGNYNRMGGYSAMEGNGGRMQGTYSAMEGNGGRMGGRMEGNTGAYSRMEGDMEMRRRRDSRGRYMEGNSSRMTEEPDGQNPYGEQPDVYRQQEDRQGNGEMRRMMDGKTSGGEIDYQRPDGGSGNVRYFMHKTDPLDQRDGQEHFQQRQIGFQQAQEKGLDKETVMEWVENMEDSEGVKGGKYTWHQAQQYAMNKGITGQKRMLEFYWAMNAMYSDFHEAGKKFGVDKPEFYACLAKLFIEDPDAVDNKVEEYAKHIVKRE